MIRKFNYTNRKDIPRKHIFITVLKSSGRYSFVLFLDSEKLDFPPESKVYVEAYYGATFLRFSCGNFGDIIQPTNSDITELKEFSERIFFRIKIVDETSENGLLLGFADKVPLSDDTERQGAQSILFVNPILMDTNEIWRINFEEAAGPILEVNRTIEGIKDIAKSEPMFISLVYPAAIRQILNRIEESNTYSREGDEWESNWIKFAENTLLIKNTPDSSNDKDDVEVWKDNVIRAFCLRFKTLDRFKKQSESWV